MYAYYSTKLKKIFTNHVAYGTDDYNIYFKKLF